ncbi:hypothetical protein [Rhizobium sp. Rhizsp82]|uniref:hypothetical protein n=1 Tax=Rhizobium sp. Rhizsp82 TaxID=3243057 RepID=UPI0039B5D66C
MAIDFQAIVESQLADGISPRMRPFLIARPRGSTYEQTWEYYAFAYENAFEALAQHYCRVYPKQQYLLIPLVQLARHSIELSLKSAIDECTYFLSKPRTQSSHNLLHLYDSLNQILLELGMIDEDDEWTKSSRRFLVHISEVDPRGMTFRYPSDLAGSPFDPIDVDLEGLIRAHSHITGMADATTTMLQERANYPYERYF